MPISTAYFIRSTAILLITGAIALVAIVAMTIWLGERSRSYFDAFLEARNARAAAVNLRDSLQVAETSQRGFILTGNENYLMRYGPAHDAITKQYETLQGVLKLYPEKAQAVANLKLAVDQKIAEMDETIRLKRDGRNAEALAIINTDKGKALMDEALMLFNDVIGAADERLFATANEQRDSSDWLRWVSIIGGLIILVVAGGSAGIALKYTQELATARDEVTALNEGLEQRVAERTAELELANHEIQRFAYIVTHDLRAPLVNIMGFTSELEAALKNVQELLEKTGSVGEPQGEAGRLAVTEDMPEAIGFIRSSTRKMDALINAILKLSREGRRVLKPEKVELSELLTNAAAAIQHQVSDANGEIKLELNVPTIISDKLSLEQIVGNLLDNAVKYRAKDRPLRIAVRTRPASANLIMMEIEDNGRGVAKEDQDRIFELFRRSGVQDQAGEGIGLAYVKAVVRNLGGAISFTSTLGQGTTFNVSLPRTLQAIRSTGI